MIAEADQQNLLSQRIRPDISYGEDQFPLVVLSLQTSEPVDTLNGEIASLYRFRCNIYAQSREQAELIVQDLRGLDGYELEDSGKVWCMFVESQSNSFVTEDETGNAYYQASLEILLYILYHGNQSRFQC